MATCGTCVPHLDVYGHQHHRVPFKNTFHTSNTTHLDRWTKVPRVQTRSQLNQVRLNSKVPHISYDIDGDGVVGQKDLYMASFFDVGKKAYLTDEERNRCAQTMAEGFTDKISWGHDRVGVHRPFKVAQRRGRILSIDNVEDMGQTYPPHPNAAKVPMHRTWTEMGADRHLERRCAAEVMINTWDGQHPDKIREAYPPQEWKNETPVITNTVQRAQADHEEQRTKSGLYPIPGFANPDREHMVVGLGYQTSPAFKTRPELVALRKELIERASEEQRERNESVHVPFSVRTSQKEGVWHDYRKAEGSRETTYTATLMKRQRKRERREYDLAHFGLQQKQNPRYSDQSHPWWTMDPTLSTQRHLARSISAPAMVLKNEDQFQDHVGIPTSAPEANGDRNSAFRIKTDHRENKVAVGEKTALRWSEDMLINFRLNNQPRYFDTLKPLPTRKQDTEPLSTWSSFECIKRDLLRNRERTLFDTSPAAAKKGKLVLVETALPRKSVEKTASTSFTNSDKTKSLASGSLLEPRSREVRSSIEMRSTVDSARESKLNSLYMGNASTIGNMSKERLSPTRPKEKTASSVLDQPTKVQTIVLEAPRGPDLNMMDRTLSKGFFAGVRGSGFR